jgi:hypothetical protein
MLIIETWSSQIVDKGVIVQGRAQYVLLQIGNDCVGCLNVYAPNSEQDKKTFWEIINNGIPTTDCWCTRDDFNVIKTIVHRKGGSCTTIHRPGLSVREQLCFNKQLDCERHLYRIGHHNSWTT